MTRCRLALVIAVTLAPAIAAAQSAQILHAFGVEPGLPRYGLVRAPDGAFRHGRRRRPERRDLSPHPGRPAVGAPPVRVRLSQQRPGPRHGRGPLRHDWFRRRGQQRVRLGFDPTSGALRRLYEFTNADDGVSIGGVTFGPDGLLYGATSYGGALGSAGTLYRVHPATGATTIFHHFSNSGPDGRSPDAGITLAADGRLYGVTRLSDDGSVNGYGTLYRVDPATATVTTVLHWDPLGGSPDETLTATSDGALYGVTSYGGPFGGGTVFRADPAAAP